MEAVQAQVLSHYRSELVDRIRAKGHVLSADGLLTVKLAKEFGFCYGVERAIDLAYAARKVFLDQPIYILGEIIHNPEVNDQIRNLGIQSISAKPTDEEMECLRKGDVVIRPARGPGRPKADNPKQMVTLRLDADLLDRLRQTGPGWQSRLNDAVRAWMEQPAHDRPAGPVSPRRATRRA